MNTQQLHEALESAGYKTVRDGTTLLAPCDDASIGILSAYPEHENNVHPALGFSPQHIEAAQKYPAFLLPFVCPPPPLYFAVLNYWPKDDQQPPKGWAIVNE
jgi:hypothetical protein